MFKFGTVLNVCFFIVIFLVAFWGVLGAEATPGVIISGLYHNFIGLIKYVIGFFASLVG